MSTLRTLPTRLPRLLSRRQFSTTLSPLTSFKSGPAPPRLPKEEQEIFEKLQKASTGAFSQPRDIDPTPSSSSQPNIRMRINQSPDSTPTSTQTTSSSSSSSSPTSRPAINQSPDSSSSPTDGAGEIRFENGKAIKKGEEFHPNMRRGAPPEFEGDVNPKTGEVGGPKNEPLRWGGSADWSYNGRVTDF
ncbi:hypothetical protein NX059_008631 [Plenodomus lindquistii]|nr:hypothetical protein NX059_008631 [Plenodomus lindquistii]